MNVKLDPELITSIKNTKGFAPAYHMNKMATITSNYEIQAIQSVDKAKKNRIIVSI